MARFNRFDDALNIQMGACNGVAIAGALHAAYRDAMAETRSTGAANKDPAVQLILHQLCHLAGMGVDDYNPRREGFDYDTAQLYCAERCQCMKTIDAVYPSGRVRLFVCDHEGL